MVRARLAWEQFFNSATLQRGQRYAEQDRVELIDLNISSANEWRIMAEVEGSNQQLYSCDIYIINPLFNNKGDLLATSIASNCDCPVNAMCKHAVAAIAVALEAMVNGERR